MPAFSGWWSSTRHDHVSLFARYQSCVAAVPSGTSPECRFIGFVCNSALFPAGHHRSYLPLPVCRSGPPPRHCQGRVLAARSSAAAERLFHGALETGQCRRFLAQCLPERTDCPARCQLDGSVPRFGEDTACQYAADWHSAAPGDWTGQRWNESCAARYGGGHCAAGNLYRTAEALATIQPVRRGPGAGTAASFAERSTLQISSYGCLCPETLVRSCRAKTN